MSIDKKEPDKKNILYIEDDPNNRMLMKRILEQEGYIVEEARDAFEGMDVLKVSKPDLILMDINMPGMNGYELTTKIKNDEELSSIPIVAVTVAVGKGEKEMAIMAGCDGFIAKPIDVDQLPLLVEEYLKGRKDEVMADEKSHYLKEYSRRLVIRLDEKIEELSIAQKEWEDTFNAIRDIVAILDLESNVVDANKAFLEKIEYDENDVIKKKFHLSLCNLNTPCLDCPYLETIRTQKPANIERHNPNLGGVYNINTYPVFNKSGHIVRVILIANDITSKKEIEEQVYQMEKLAEMGGMVAAVAHELNNPLTNIIEISHLTLMNNSLSPQTKKDIETILSESERMARITKGLLIFSRKSKMEKRALNINSVLTGMLTFLGYQLKYNSITLITEFFKTIPEVNGDFYQLQQVFINIINNASDAFSLTDKKATITIKTEQIDNNVAISFIDNGPGIKKEDIQKVFEPFFTTKPPGKGTGLGLSICKKIINAQNGTIEVKSEEGNGATFEIRLPIVDKEV